MSLSHFRNFLCRVFATARPAPSRRTVLGVEAFEDRRVPAGLTASLSADGILHVVGTPGADRIVVREKNDQISLVGTKIQVNGAPASTISAASVKGIDVRGRGGDDHINLASNRPGMQQLRAAPRTTASTAAAGTTTSPAARATTRSSAARGTTASAAGRATTT
jgi:hypothetical protein